jgi:hypothetical protein
MQGASGFKHDDLASLRGDGAVLDDARDDEEFSGAEDRALQA